MRLDVARRSKKETNESQGNLRQAALLMSKVMPSRQLHGAWKDLYERRRRTVAWSLRNTCQGADVLTSAYTCTDGSL